MASFGIIGCSPLKSTSQEFTGVCFISILKIGHVIYKYWKTSSSLVSGFSMITIKQIIIFICSSESLIVLFCPQPLDYY